MLLLLLYTPPSPVSEIVIDKILGDALMHSHNDWNDERYQQLSGEFILEIYTDAGRPTAGTQGRVIFNSDDGQLNIDDGTNWTLPDGTTT